MPGTPIRMKNTICTAAVVALISIAATTSTNAHAAPAPRPPAPAPTGTAPGVDPSTRLAGRTVFLDPGHQGGAMTPAMLSRPVSDGRGGTKACQTTGMTTMHGQPEHTVTWQVSQLVKGILEKLGARVVLSRADDVGWGGCVTDRAKAANASGAAIAISIHADGAPAGLHGFHLIVPKLPVPDQVVNRVQSTTGRAATKAVHDAYVKAGFTPAGYAGAVDGIQTRADIAGPALTTVPNVFLEMGNGANPADAALLETPQGQLKHAIAIATGMTAYLLGTTPGGTTPSPSVFDKQSQPGTGSSGTTTPGKTTLSGFGETVLQLFQPLLQTLGVDIPGGSSEFVNVLADLASAALGAALQKFATGGN